MIEFLIGVDGGGSGTRVRLADAGGRELGLGQSGPSGLGLGIASAWNAVGQAIAAAFAAASLPQPGNERLAIGLGLAGVHNKQWAAEFCAVQPGFAAIVLASDATTTLFGAHQGQPGAIIALGTGSVGEVLLPDGSQREVGGWGFPAGDEASGGWMGLRAMNHVQQVQDGRQRGGALANAIIAHCGGSRDTIQAWLARANQTAFATLAPLVLAHAANDHCARAIVDAAAAEVARMAEALDPGATLPLALCGGLGEPLRPFLAPALAARCLAPQGDAASGALRLIQHHLKG